MSRTRVLGALAALLVAIGLVACGSNDNGGVIDNPTVTSAPPGGASTTTAGGGTPGY